MSEEKQNRIMETITESIPVMDEFDKGYFLAKAEVALDRKKRNSSGDENHRSNE